MRTLLDEGLDYSPASRRAVRDWIRARVAADTQMRDAAARRAVTPSGPGDDEASLEATVVLTRQHNQVRALQEQLEAIPSTRTGGTASDFAQRKSIVDLMANLLSRHETAEKAHLWPAVRSVLPDGDRWAGGALAQEQEGKDLLAELGRLAPDTAGFDELAEKLVLALRKHMAYEEELFLRLREAMPEEDRQQLGRRLLAGGKRKGKAG